MYYLHSNGQRQLFSVAEDYILLNLRTTRQRRDKTNMVPQQINTSKSKRLSHPENVFFLISEIFQCLKTGISSEIDHYLTICSTNSC